MLSGNGRHRRPRQAPALLVAAGVTGSAIAIPLLGATGASAATGTTWDQVANCETEGSWSANEGDGHYGGLNIAQKDWEQYGGLDYATRADQASRNQQIAVAEKILADQGVGYWSTCGLLNGLTKSSEAADVDTGVGVDTGSGTSNDSGSSGLSDSEGSSADSSGSGSSDGASGTPSASASDTPSSSSSDSSSGSSDGASRAGNSAKSGTSADSGSGSSGSQDSGDTSAGTAKQDDSGDSDNSWRVGGSSSLVDTGALGGGKHRGGSADEDAAVDTADAGTSSGRHAAGGETYTVRVGDTLESIADSLDLQGGWRALYEENKQAIGSDPSHISPGQTLGLGAE
ncbi:transglycosylase family protein [Streptomyces sp. NPDC005263]|uniref:transglycosylase family protein n=1 Tax=Streptomyces sp. NPDC005263 TaxID=3364711 RepID=UPI003688EB80